jgi:hypothetical protein
MAEWELHSVISTTGNHKLYVKAEVAITVFELLMMGDVSPGTC